jgi:hypothetical protein
MAFARGSTGEMWIGLPITAAATPWSAQLRIDTTSTTMPILKGVTPVNYNARLITMSSSIELFYVDGRVGTSIGVGLVGEDEAKKVYLRLENTIVPGVSSYIWEIQHQATTHDFVVRDEAAGTDRLIIKKTTGQINLGGPIVATALSGNIFQVISPNGYLFNVEDSGADAIKATLTAKSAQYLSLASAEWQSMITGSRSLGFSALSGYIEFYTTLHLGLKISTVAGAAAIGFYGANPVIQHVHIADAAGGTEIATINSILSTLEAYGLLALV